MMLKLKVTVPTFKGVISTKVTNAFAKSLKLAQQRIIPLVVNRAQELVDKAAPEMAVRYKKALSVPGVVKVTDKAVTIDVKDPVVVAFENGAKAWDMKQKLLAHAKTSKSGGQYVDVPFTHKASSVPAPVKSKMARAARKNGADSVRLLARTSGKASTKLLNRGRAAQAIGIKAKKQKVQHKRGLRDDLIRASKDGARGSTFKTIRRISTNSPASSWMHPGFKAHHLLDKVLPGLKREITEVIRDAFITGRST